MSASLTDPAFQTCLVGFTITSLSAAATFYIWLQDRRERYLLFWSISWLATALRWSILGASGANPAVTIPVVLLAATGIVLQLLGAYDVLPVKRWRISRVALFLAGIFAAVIFAGQALDRMVLFFYGGGALYALVVMWCLWLGYRASGLSGFAVAATAYLFASAFYGVGVLIWGTEVRYIVLGPLTVLPVVAGFLLIAFQRSRQRIQDAERKLRKIFDTAPIPIVITRPPHGEIEEFNQATMDMVGLGREQIAGKTALEIGVVGTPESRRAIYEALDAGQGIARGEIVYLRGTERRPATVSASRIDLKDGPRNILAVYDLTELHRAQRALEKLNAELESRVEERTGELRAALTELDAFSYSVSHDLSAPVGAVGGLAHLLRSNEGTRLSDDGRRLLGMIELNAERMVNLIDGLLRLSQAGRGTIRRIAFSMEELAREVLRETDGARGADTRLGKLPDCEGDPVLLRQVWNNLIGNARKYSRTRDPALIEIGWDSGRQAYFVRDNGVGFDMQNAGKLFGVFERLHGQSEFEGTGIGLATVRRIVERHDGKIWADAAPDGGATFWFTVPGMSR